MRASPPRRVPTGANDAIFSGWPRSLAAATTVPRAYLEGWAEDANAVHAYRLLVSTDAYPVWRRHPIGGLLYFEDLYTSVSPDGGDADVF